MAQPFNAVRAMGIAPQPVDDYFGGDDFPQIGSPIEPNPTYTLSGVQSQPFATPMGLGTYDPIQEQVANQQAQEAAAKRQAQQEIFNGNTDWTSDEGRQTLQNYVARGVVSPTEARAIAYASPKAQKQNRYSTVPVEVAEGLNKLAQIDPSDPDAWTNLQKAVSPDNVPVDVQSHPQFQSDFKELKKEIQAQKQHMMALGKHDPDEELIGKAQAAGVAPEELAPYLDENGKVGDKIGLRNAMFQASTNKNILGGEAGKKLSDLLYASSAVAPTDEEKNEWLARHPEAGGPDKFVQAWNGVKADKMANYKNYLSALESAGYKRLPRAQDQAPQPQAQVQAPSFNTPEEAEASGVPSGTVVIIGGRRFRKN